MSGILRRNKLNIVVENEFPHRRTPRRFIPPETTYTIRIKTAPDRHASTDANVFLQLVGRNGGVSSTIKCIGKQGKHFERGKVDIYRVKTVCLGDLLKLKIWHDNTGKTPSWKCAGIQVDDLTMKRRYHFTKTFWLSTVRDDRMIYREIACSGRSIILKLYPGNVRTSESTSSARDMGGSLKTEAKSDAKTNRSEPSPKSSLRSKLAPPPETCKLPEVGNDVIESAPIVPQEETQQQ